LEVPVDTLSRRRFLQHTGVVTAATAAVTALPAFPARAAGLGLTAGAARRDITPANGGNFFGYVRPDMIADGVALRLFAHALVLDDGERRLALVIADLGSPSVYGSVLQHARALGFDESTLLVAATHTHAAPDSPGDWIAQQIGDAIEEALDRRVPAAAGWGLARVDDVNISRSIEAHLANHGMDLEPGFGGEHLDPDGPDHPRDLDLRLLRVEATDGRPIAAWSHFSVHPTAFGPDNTLFSADLMGSAVRRFTQAFRGAAPVAMMTNGNQGDLIPWYDDINQHAVSDRNGLRLARGMATAWRAAGRSLQRRLVVDGRATVAVYEGQEVAPDKRVARQAVFGVPFLGGAKNGPSPFFQFGLEGRRRPAALADPVHGRKIVAAPAPWSSNVRLQALRIGDRLLLTVPGEPSVEAGRRMRAEARRVAPADIRDSLVVSLANGYHGYFTTPEEYEQQHYEGGHTVFGKHTTLLVERTHEELARQLRERGTGSSGPAGERPARVDAPVGAGAEAGELELAPPDVVERFDVVRFAWRGGMLGRDRPVGSAFLRLERLDEGTWRTTATDLGRGFVWQERLGRYEGRYDVPADARAGRYRLRVTAARYELLLGRFRIVPSTALRLRGVQLLRVSGGAAEIAFVAQHPAPDPTSQVLARAQRPTGGSVRFRAGGRERTARWDDRRNRWVATVPGLRRGDEVEVVAGGLVDSLGNRSGAAQKLTVGEVAELDWPPHHGPAGGGSPGPFGIGRFESVYSPPSPST
jgi:neutral ceramidase